jgi:hypothetical protein
MTLKDVFKRRASTQSGKEDAQRIPTPELKITRSDTNTQEELSGTSQVHAKSSKSAHTQKGSRIRSLSHAVIPFRDTSAEGLATEEHHSSLLHLRSQSRESRRHSVNLPSDLPEIHDASGDVESREARWEERATLLAQGGINLKVKEASRRTSVSSHISDQRSDV